MFDPGGFGWNFFTLRKKPCSLEFLLFLQIPEQGPGPLFHPLGCRMDWSFGRFFHGWKSRKKIKAKPHNSSRKSRTGRLFVEQLEGRTLMSVLPVPLVSNQIQLPAFFPNPQANFPLTDAKIVLDPADPMK